MPDPNLWKAAQACIDAYGDGAEVELGRRARVKFDAGELAEVTALFEIAQAVKHLRGVAALGTGTAH